jgi:acetolactate synthase-1/2/3 large subunit
MLTSGGLGTMSYGLSTAIGAKMAWREFFVINIDGHASFNMALIELCALARDEIGVETLLLNNKELGVVSNLQKLFSNGYFAYNRDVNPDLLLASEALELVV